METERSGAWRAGWGEGIGGKRLGRRDGEGDGAERSGAERSGAERARRKGKERQLEGARGGLQGIKQSAALGRQKSAAPCA